MIDFSNIYWDELVNKSFVNLIDNQSRYLILYGGRGSSKSDFAAVKLVWRCLSEKYFKCVLIRNHEKDVRESQYETIRKVVSRLTLDKYFTFKVSPQEIICNNNSNKFIVRGCNDMSKVKSTTNPSAIWWEEDIPTYDDFNIATSTVRSNEADYIQEIFTINPEVRGGDYREHWFFKEFFADQVGKSFTNFKEFEYQGEKYKRYWTCHHSTHLDNPDWLDVQSRLLYLSYKDNDEYLYTIWTLGEWGNISADGLFYKKFNRNTNTSDKAIYNPELGLHISFDFNTNPYMSISIWQIIDKQIYCIDEITTKDPNNNTRDACRIFETRYRSHKNGLTVYGDRNGKNEDTRNEKGFNDYKIVEQELTQFRPQFRIPSSNPPVEMRGQFINCIFSENFDGLDIKINPNCSHLLGDLMNLREKSDRTKLKEKDSNGFERWGHLSDSMDYMLCEAFKSSFSLYQRGPTPVEPIWYEHIPSPKHRM